MKDMILIVVGVLLGAGCVGAGYNAAWAWFIVIAIFFAAAAGIIEVVERNSR